MRLSLFNGSPRGKTGNTKILMDQFTEGFLAHPGNSVDVAYLNRIKELDTCIEMFKDAEHVILAFPLYTDAMPGIVKAFIEALEPFCGREDNPDIGFLVQSGFPEAIHSRYVERYLKKLAVRLSCRYVGTIVKGGGEGIKDRTPQANRKLFNKFQQLGRIYGENGRFDEELVRALAKPEKFPPLVIGLFKLLANTRLATLMWDRQLKANNAYERRFDRPYTEP